MCVSIDGVVYGFGDGGTKQEAGQNAAKKKDGADNSFECVGKYGGLFAPACVFLSVAQKQILAQFQLLCNDVQRGFANGTCARAGHHALVHFGVIQI